MNGNQEPNLTESFIKLSETLQNVKSTEETISLYNEWSQTYDSELESLSYTMPKTIVDLLDKAISNDKDLSKSASVIDFAVGTGLVGEQLRLQGFTGRIDAHDGSEAMLEVAKSKNGVYTDTFCQIMKPETCMLEGLTGGTYDVAIICTTLQAHLIHYTCLKHFINAIRVGGLFLFSLRKPDREVELEYSLGLQREAYKLEKMGIWKLVDVKFNPCYRIGFEVLDENDDMASTAMCYKKLKNL